MNIIITMAGEGRRFKEIGITTPKHMIAVKGKTLFEWAMFSLENFYDKQFIFITQKDYNAGPFILEKSQSLGIKKIYIQELGVITKGQAETALAAGEVISDQNEEIMIYNIDTYVEPHQLKPEHIKGDGWVPAFEAEGERWSFVKIDKDFRVIDVTEKIRISNYATIGLYYFKSFKLYQRLYSEYTFDNKKERYIAPLYSLMIHDRTFSIYSHIIDKNAVHVLGTPEDIKQFDPGFMANKMMGDF